MVDVATSVNGANQVAPANVQPVAAPADLTAQKDITLPKPSSQAVPFTNRVYQDPISGVFVSDQINPDGQVVAQTPQGITLTYLQNGLTADGFPKNPTIISV